MLSAAVARADGAYTPYFDHMTLMVTLEERWLVEVGFGDTFRQPLLIDHSHDQIHLRRLGIGYRAALVLEDMAHRLFTGRPSPYQDGLIPVGQQTPTQTLNLERGELVEVRSQEEICGTNTTENRNRGMLYGPEMAEYSGRRFKVDRRVERLIDERTGKMLAMRHPCIVLEGVVCASDYSERRLFCPLAIQPYFREIWLRRASSESRDGDDES
jgi:hypothetical protein